MISPNSPPNDENLYPVSSQGFGAQFSGLITQPAGTSVAGDLSERGSNDTSFSFHLHAQIHPRGGLHSIRPRGGSAIQCRTDAGLARRASDLKAAVALFPELGISAYSNEDLFHQDALLDATEAALARLIAESRDLSPVLLVGAPLRFEGKLFNCAVTIYRGRVLGIMPKTYLPNYREFYEKRQFTSGRNAVSREVMFLGEVVPFGTDLIFDARTSRTSRCTWRSAKTCGRPIPPSTYAALAGATVLANLSASNITIGKAEYRRDLCASQSGRCVAAYLYSAAGPGESTTDLAWDGHAIIYENNELLAESNRFSSEEQIIVADIDLERLAQDRMRMTSFNDAVGRHRGTRATDPPGRFRIPDA